MEYGARSGRTGDPDFAAVRCHDALRARQPQARPRHALFGGAAAIIPIEDTLSLAFLDAATTVGNAEHNLGAGEIGLYADG